MGVIAAFEDGDAAIRSTKVDADDFCHKVESIFRVWKKGGLELS